MIIEIENQKVEIIIPKKVSHKFMFKRVYYDIEEYKLGDIKFFDDTMKNQFKEVKTLGIWMSGGADSSILAYLLAKKIIDEKLSINILPLSVRRTRPWNPLYAQNVVDFIEENLKFKFLDHKIFYPDINDSYQCEDKEFRDRNVELFEKDEMQILYSGITCNPPNDAPIDKNKERVRDVDAKREIYNESPDGCFINPFFNINKKFIYKIYHKFDLLNTLFPITRSCEGSIEDSGNYTYHCGKCWWCEERLWAFGKLQ